MTVAALAGVVLAAAVTGHLHLRTTRVNAELFARGRPAAAMALQLLRFALLAGVLLAFAKIGAAALLAGSLALLLARHPLRRALAEGA